MGKKGCWLSVQWMTSFSVSQRRSDILGLSKDSCALSPLPGVLIQWFRMCPGPAEIWKIYANKADSYPRLCVCCSCLTLCHPMDCSPPGFSVYGILLARILESAAIPFSRGIFPTEGSDPDLPHCHLTHQGVELFLKVLQAFLPSLVLNIR